MLLLVYVICERPLINFCRQACGIDLGDRYVVTGGYEKKGKGRTKQKVVQYSVTGDLTLLPDLKTGRHAHACSKYSDDDGKTVSLILSTINV